MHLLMTMGYIERDGEGKINLQYAFAPLTPLGSLS